MIATILYVLLILIVLNVLLVILIVLAGGADMDEPEAAEAPDDDLEPRCRITPRVVAGSDLDRHRRPMPQVNADLSALIDADPQLASLRKLDLSDYYVLPEGDR